MTNICSTVVLLLFTVTHCVQSVAMRVIPYGYSKSRKIQDVPLRRFRYSMGKTTCNVSAA